MRISKRLLVAVFLSVTLLGVFTPEASAARCYSGTDKGMFQDNKGWHHYVEFLVDVSMPDQYWYIQSVPRDFPFKADLWPNYYQIKHDHGGPAIYKEVGYNWLWRIPDIYPASEWVICHR